MSNVPNFPCRGCTNRKSGCHDTCESYQKVKDEYEEFKHKKRVDDVLGTYKCSLKIKAMNRIAKDRKR